MSKFWLMLCLLIIPFASVTAQGDTHLRFGRSVGGFINETQFRQLYVFSANSGQIVSLAMTATDGDLDPYLVLMSPNGNVIATSDDDGVSNNAVISVLQLAVTGDYVVIATRFGQEHGITTGSYRLSLEEIGSINTMTGDTIRFSSPVIGQLDNTTYEKIYRFEALRGQVINIQLQRTSGNLDPLLDLFDAAGQALVSGDDDPSSADSKNAGIVNFMVPTDGIYFIRATRYGREAGNTSGSYVLTMHEVPVEILGTSPGNARLMSYGDNLDATITPNIWTRFFQFEGSRGDVVSVLVTRDEGNLAPQVKILNKDLKQLSTSPDSAAVTQATLTAVALQETDTYYLVVTRYRGAEGTSEGVFSIQLNGRQGIGGESELEITYGAQVSGIIDTNTPIETYIFFGNADDVVTITMERGEEGDLDALLTLKDATGKQLAFNDDSDEDTQNATIRRFTLPDDGYYTIEASRFERELGKTAGIYLLTLEKEN